MFINTICIKYEKREHGHVPSLSLLLFVCAAYENENDKQLLLDLYFSIALITTITKVIKETNVRDPNGNRVKIEAHKHTHTHTMAIFHLFFYDQHLFVALFDQMALSSHIRTVILLSTSRSQMFTFCILNGSTSMCTSNKKYVVVVIIVVCT